MEFASHVVWPLAVLIAIVLFRNPLSKLLDRVMRLNVEAGKFKLETLMRDYVPPHVLSELRRNPHQLKLSGERRHVTILYSEMRGFTAMLEGFTPEAAAQYIHVYLTKMTEIIFQLGGTLDRYEGTAFTAYWGAPIAYEDASERACNAALNMNEAVKILSPKLQEEGYPPLLLTITITSAEVIVGNLGSEQRFNYSIVGDYYFVLGELARMNYNFKTSILITEYTYAEIKHKFDARLLGENVHVRGKPEPINVYELLSKKNRNSEK